MERIKNNNLAKAENYEIPDFLPELNKYTGILPDETEISNLFDPPDLPLNPPEGWITHLSQLKPIDKAVVHSLLGSARVNELLTVGQIRIKSIEELITLPVSTNSTNIHRKIGVRRAFLLKQLFEPPKDQVEVSTIN